MVKVGELNVRLRFWKSFLVLLAVFLVFVGPTFFVYFVGGRFLGWEFAFVLGFLLFVVGFVLVLFVVRSGEKGK